ncbi:MAG: AraC family transcriptional regulator [Dysgonamonadaceae bacterium]|jgi:AraC-like DNA-binding protein|nr:AraC family transcriptional regulator [Dysgonamonadaceae bacterium]
MNVQGILREVTPLSEKDCFYLIERMKSEFTYPIHIHPEFEINYIENAKNAQRIVGDSIEEIDDLELVLITGANLEHAWINRNCRSKQIKEITIQFHEDLFSNQLTKNQFNSIRTMFDRAKHGLLFSRATIEAIKPKLLALVEEKNGFYSLLKLTEIMYDLSMDNEARVLSSCSFSNTDEINDSRIVKKALTYLQENYQRPIKLDEVASLVNMTPVSFSRFIKKRTSRTFIDYLNGIRLGIATRMLVDTSEPICEICYNCGFNNLSNFNRIFKTKKGCTPKEFRENYSKKKIVI